MANGMMGNPMGAQQSPMEQPMNNQGMQMGGIDDSVLDMHLTQDVKQALQAKGVDVSAVAVPFLTDSDKLLAASACVTDSTLSFS